MSGLTIAMVGQRGIPATFGGIEHHVEELGSLLVDRGHRVIVYARPNYLDRPMPTYRGMEIRVLPTIDSKHLDAIVHSGLASADAMRRGVDIVHYHAIGPGLVAPLPRYLSRAKVVLTVHGRDGERAKWGRAASAVLSTAEWMSARVPDATIVVSKDLRRHYALAYRRATAYIPNGVYPGEHHAPNEIRKRWGLEPGSYVLFVGRLVPEKAPDLLMRAFRGMPGSMRLIVAGGSSFTDAYVTLLEREAERDERVTLAGYVFGDTLAELYAHAAAFVLPSALEGLPLTLLEAAAYGTPLVASDIPPHLEVVGQDAPGHRVFASGSADALRAGLERALAKPDAERAAAEAFRDDVLERYRWDRAAEETERLYTSLVR